MRKPSADFAWGGKQGGCLLGRLVVFSQVLPGLENPSNTPLELEVLLRDAARHGLAQKQETLHIDMGN